MKKAESILAHEAFEQTIKAFRQNPEDYTSPVRNRITRQLQNAAPAFVAWLLLATGLNALGIYYFSMAQDGASAASLLALCALLVTVAARSYTVNYLTYHTIGRLRKWHGWHYVTERIGFLHRLMAVSTFAWLGVHAAHVEFAAPYVDEILLGTILLLLLVIMLTALAVFRRRNHDRFENFHRYMGWTSVGLLVAYFAVGSVQAQQGWAELLVQPEPYLLLILIAMLVAPWLGVREAYPELVHVGPHVIGLRLQGPPSYGTYSRVTLGNRHFHPFGDSMIDFNDPDSRVLYITPSGDRTTEVVEGAKAGNFPLSEFTIRKDRFKGFMYHHSIYDHILIVVTGGGIAPIIPCLILNKHTRINVLWIGKSQSEEFGDDLLAALVNKIADQDIHLHILNTDDEDLKHYTNRRYISLIQKACEHYRPEAVFVMSNQPFTIDVMHALRQRSEKVYGATFDS